MIDVEGDQWNGRSVVSQIDDVPPSEWPAQPIRAQARPGECFVGRAKEAGTGRESDKTVGQSGSRKGTEKAG